MLLLGDHTLEHDARGNKQEEDATVILNQDDQEASTLVLAETFTAPVMDGGGSRDSEEICNKNGRASAASPPLCDKKSAAEKEQGVSDQDQTLSTPSVESTSAAEGGQATSSDRPQSPVTQTVESSFRKMVQGVTGSIDAASASLKESLGDVHQHLLHDFGDTERQMVEQLERIQADYSRKTCFWLRRQQYAGLDQAHVEEFELGRTEVDKKCQEIVAKAFQDRCTAIERRMTDMIDEIKDAFDGYLDDTTASAKQHLRWIKRQYREKIDVNRAASRIELGDTLLLDRCILEEKVQQMNRRHEEEIGRLQVEFQLERSDLRKAKRELEQSVQVLQLGKALAEQDAAQAHRSIESLEEEIYAIRTFKHSEDGSVKSHGSAKSYGSAKSHRKLVRGRSGTSLRGVGGASPRASARGVSPLMTSRNGSHGGGGGGGGGQGPRHASRHESSLMKARASASSRGGIAQEQNAGVNDIINARSVNNASETKHAPASGSRNTGSPERGPSRGPTSARYRGRGGSTALGGLHDQQSARGVGPLDSSRSLRGGGGESGQDTEHIAGWGGTDGWQDTHTNPAARHEEARHVLEQDAADKLTRVIELKKMANLKEELDDEILNRQAAQARVALVEQTMAKLQGDLKKAQEQLVQARMETNELRKITHVLTADARQAEIYQKQEEQSTKVNSAAALLAGNGDSGNGGTGSDGDSASIAVGSRNTVASLRGATGDKTAQLRLYRPNPGRATPDRELPEWAVQLPAEDTDSDGASKSQVEDPEEERDVAVEEMPTLRGNAKQRGRLLVKEEGKLAVDRPSSPSSILMERLEIAALKESRRELEARVARMQVASDENGYLRRRLEAIERTALKLNFGGVNNELKILRERLDVESGEVLRLRKRVDSLQAEKLAMSEAAAKLSDESVPLVKLAAERTAFENRMAEQARRYEEEVSRLELELTRLTDVKAEFEKLAETDFQESDSDDCNDGEDSNGAERSGGQRNGKWKMRVKNLQKYIQWQTAEAETQARRDRAEMELNSRSHEMLMGEMTVLVRGYRREQARLYEVNRALVQRLEELEAKPLSPTTHSPSSLVGGGGGDYLRGDTKTVALTTLNKEGQRKKRQRSHGDAQQSVAAKSAVLAPTPIAFVPVHTLDKTPPFAGSPLPRVLTETASSSNLTGAVSPENMLSKNSINSLRPRTSTGCERGTRSATFPDTRGVKGVQDSRKREKSATRRGVEDVAWQLRSRLRDEYFGPRSHLPGARERAKYISAVTARHTTRHPMVLGKPLSSVTGSFLTNVPLCAKVVDHKIPRPDKWKSGVASRSVRPERNEDGGGSMHGGELW